MHRFILFFVLRKMDLIEEDDIIHQKIKEYKESGYEVYVSGKGYACDELIQALKGKISVLTGQSGDWEKLLC